MTDIEERRRIVSMCRPVDGCPLIDERYLDRLAERAADKAVEKVTSRVYQQVGKGVLSKFIYIVGAVVIGAWLWFKSRGFIQ